MRIQAAIIGILLVAHIASGQEKDLQTALAQARSHGAQSVEVAQALALLGVFYQEVGRFPEAESSFRKSLKIVSGIHGRQDELQMFLIGHLAWIYVETGRR